MNRWPLPATEKPDLSQSRQRLSKCCFLKITFTKSKVACTIFGFIETRLDLDTGYRLYHARKDQRLTD